MDADNFSDPRRRSTRGRGGTRGRGRGTSRGRGRSSKQGVLSRRKAEELGSNAYRFREPDQNEEDEDEFEVGIDIEEAAASSMADDPHAEAYRLDTDVLGSLFKVNVDGIEKALRSVPQWIVLGDASRFALGVADDDVVDNYLDPFDDEEKESAGIEDSEIVIHEEFSQALADLNFDEQDEESKDENADVATLPTGKSGGDGGAARAEVKQATISISHVEDTITEDPDDFDRWLDDV